MAKNKETLDDRLGRMKTGERKYFPEDEMTLIKRKKKAPTFFEGIGIDKPLKAKTIVSKDLE